MFASYIVVFRKIIITDAGIINENFFFLFNTLKLKILNEVPHTMYGN